MTSCRSCFRHRSRLLQWASQPHGQRLLRSLPGIRRLPVPLAGDVGEFGDRQRGERYDPQQQYQDRYNRRKDGPFYKFLEHTDLVCPLHGAHDVVFGQNRAVTIAWGMRWGPYNWCGGYVKSFPLRSGWRAAGCPSTSSEAQWPFRRAACRVRRRRSFLPASGLSKSDSTVRFCPKPLRDALPLCCYRAQCSHKHLVLQLECRLPAGSAPTS